MYCIGLEDVPGCEPVTKSPTFVNVAFLGNRAVARGGAISADAQCDFVCEYCIFEENSCAKKGGALYLDFDCDPTFRNTEWRNNFAEESGGVIFEGTTKFINNSAVWEGGILIYFNVEI